MLVLLNEQNFERSKNQRMSIAVEQSHHVCLIMFLFIVHEDNKNCEGFVQPVGTNFNDT